MYASQRAPSHRFRLLPRPQVTSRAVNGPFDLCHLGEGGGLDLSLAFFSFSFLDVLFTQLLFFFVVACFLTPPNFPSLTPASPTSSALPLCWTCVRPLPPLHHATPATPPQHA